MRLLLSAFSVLAVLRLDPCGGGGDDPAPGTAANNPGQNTPGQTTPGQTTPGQTTPGQTTPAGVTIPDVFYEDWLYETATLYQPGKEPIVTGISGTAKFNRDLTYVQDYFIGDINNHFEGTYTVDGPDPKINGAFFITTSDDHDATHHFKLSVSVGDTKAMVQRLYEDDGSPSIDYGLELKPKN